LIEAAFQHNITKLSGDAHEEQQPPEGQSLAENVPGTAVAPNDEDEAFMQETLQMRQAMHMSEVESRAHRDKVEKPMHQWCTKDFHENFPNSVLLPEVSSATP
jgi:hypothetical protein